MSDLEQLILEVEIARQKFITAASLANGEVKAIITMYDFGPEDKSYLQVQEGMKFLKYN